LKTIWRFLILFLLMGGFSACADKNKILEGVYQGMYDGSGQMQEMKNPEPVPPPGKESPTYEQYKKEREEMLKNQEHSPYRQ